MSRITASMKGHVEDYKEIMFLKKELNSKLEKKEEQREFLNNNAVSVMT
jgi:hypothetical protein